MIDTALPPILGEQPRTLVLGSMPGLQSLKKQQYYAHPRNCFWWIMSEVFSFQVSLDYPSRCLELIKAGVAVWDVLHQCRRKGSLDSAIERESEVANDFAWFFENHSSVRSILFNGRTAEKLFQRHCSEYSESNNIRLFSCPSTSPAFAAMSHQQKFEYWQCSLNGTINEWRQRT